MIIGPIELDEIKLAKFDFTDEAGSGATLTNPVVSVSVHKGTDASPTVLVGAATLVGSVVHQRVQPGLLGVTYKLRATVEDSASGLKHGMTGLLEVVRG